MLRFRPSGAVVRVVESSRRAIPILGAAERELVSLALGEPDFPTPAPIVDAMNEALREGRTRYGDFDGDPELRAALAATIPGATGPESVLITHGSMAGIASAILAVVSAGDEVVLPEPTYSLYADLIRMAGGEPVFVPVRDDYHLDLGALRGPCARARLLVLCNPCNPTGAVFGRDELEALAAIVAQGDALVLVDEAYERMVHDGIAMVTAAEIPALCDRLILARTFSKTYAMTGFRVGYLHAPPAILRAAALVHHTFNGPVNAAVQRAALRALGDDGAMVRPMLEAYARRRALLLRLLQGEARLEIRAPEGTFYAFAKVLHPIGSIELTARLRRGGVLVRPGIEFGPSGEHHLRLSFAPSEAVLEEGAKRLRAVLAGLGST